MQPDPPALGVDALDTRSIVLSALLGSHPPTLPVRALVDLAELFGVRSGTVRTALSRMVASGELTTDDGWYRLTGRHLDRQREQQEGQTPCDEPWDGTWWSVTVEADRRDIADRRSFRSSLEGARFGELRPDIWLRPANSGAPPTPSGTIVMRGAITVDDVHDLVARLWPLDEIEQRARRLLAAIEQQRVLIESDRDADLPAGFLVAAASVRFLRTEPQLPAELTPTPWTVPELRAAHDHFSQAFGERLRVFFAD